MKHEFDFDLRFAIPENKWENIDELAAPVVGEDFEEAVLGIDRKGVLAIGLVVPGDDQVDDPTGPCFMKSNRIFLASSSWKTCLKFGARRCIG